MKIRKKGGNRIFGVSLDLVINHIKPSAGSPPSIFDICRACGRGSGVPEEKQKADNSQEKEKDERKRCRFCFDQNSQCRLLGS